MAVDDFSFTPSCRVNTVDKLPSYFFSTPAPDLTCGSTSQFRCKTSQECISMDMLCNFRYDCQDKSDEDFCPWTCNFDSIIFNFLLYYLKIYCSLLIYNKDNNLCNWINENKGPDSQPKIAWQLGTGSTPKTGGPQFGKFHIIQFLV